MDEPSADPPRRTQPQRRAEAEARLVDAAARLISEGGPSAVTLAKVGERAGYSRGLAAHHFGSKAALMQRVVETVTEGFGAAVLAEAAPDQTVLDEVLALARVYLDIVIDPPPVNRARLVLLADAVAHRHADGREAMVDADRQLRRIVRSRIAQAVEEAPAPVDLDPDGFAVLLVGLLRGIAFESMLDPTVDLDAARAEVEAFLTARLRPLVGSIPDDPLAT